MQEIWNVLHTVLASVFSIVLIITLIRLNGLRSLSKMSAYDFVVTIASGAIVGSMSVRTVDIVTGSAALAILFLTQYAVSKLRVKSLLGGAVDNKPVVLMKNGKYIEEAMRKTRVTKQDIFAKMRKSNVRSISSVKAVVFEATGYISIIHGDGELDKNLLEDTISMD